MNPNPRHRRDSPRRNRSFAFPLPCNAKANPNTGLTRAPIFPTFTQTFTRCVQVWAVNHQSPEPTASSPAYAALLLAWSAADVVRYAYFGLLQAGIRVDFVKWLRYSLFIVLYPVGIGIYFYSKWVKVQISGWLGAFMMYSYMLKQRRKAFRA
ncbi:putative membrane protein [Aspergillus fumigatus]